MKSAFGFLIYPLHRPPPPYCCYVQQAMPLIKINMNEHQKVSVSTAERCQCTPFFKFKSTDVNLLSCLVCLSDKMADLALWLVRSPVNQTPGEGSIESNNGNKYSIITDKIKPTASLMWFLHFLKGTGHPKMKVLWLYTHSHVISKHDILSFVEQKEDILRNILEVNCHQNVSTFFAIFSFVFHRRKKVM